MLTQKDQKTIRSKLDNIYKTILTKKDIDYFENDIVQRIKNFNKKNPKKKKKFLKKLHWLFVMVIAYIQKKRNHLRSFRIFFKKN